MKSKNLIRTPYFRFINQLQRAARTFLGQPWIELNNICHCRGCWRNRFRISGYCGKPGLSVMTRSVIVPTACPLVSARQVRLCHSGLSVDEALYDASTG